MNDNDPLSCEDFPGLIAIESATEEQDRDDEEDGRQQFVNWFKSVHFCQDFKVF